MIQVLADDMHPVSPAANRLTLAVAGIVTTAGIVVIMKYGTGAIAESIRHLKAAAVAILEGVLKILEGIQIVATVLLGIMLLTAYIGYQLITIHSHIRTCMDYPLLCWLFDE